MLRLWLAIVVSAVITSAVSAADFQVTNAIFVGQEKEPTATTQTIFKDNVVYDHSLGQSTQAMIIDFDANRITLMDPIRKCQLNVNIREVIEMATFLRTNGDFKSPLLKFCNEPDFKIQVDTKINRVVFEGNPLSYDLTTLPISDKRIVQDYARFCDWSADVNFTCAAGHPSKSRKVVNGYFAENNVLPKEIRRVIRNVNPGQNETVRSQHEYRWILNQTDLVTVQHLRDQQADFAQVSLKEWINGQAK